MSHAADLPLDNAARPPASEIGGLSTLALAIAVGFGVLLWLVVAFQALFIVPRFEKLFLDFKMKLPFFTELVIGFSRFSRHGWLLLPLCLIAAALVCIALTWQSRWAGIVLIVALPLLINLLIIASLYFPYAALVEGLGGNAPQF